MTQGGALYRKWRPQKFADLVGQDHVRQTIINAVAGDKLAHAYLFAGPRGTGKTSLARILAKAANCTNQKAGEPCDQCNNCQAFNRGNFVDLIEIDAASHTGVDDVRDLIEKVNLVPSIGRFKVYIIDEVHMLSKSAFNALLKTLEEPPTHVIFVLATTEVHKLPGTVISRCQYFDFHHLSRSEVVGQLKTVADSEKIKISADGIELIAESAEGSLRDALGLLQQAAGFGVGKVDRNELAKLLGVVDSVVVERLTQAVAAGQAVSAIDLINDIYFKGYDLNQLSKQWMNYLRELLMIKLGNQSLVDRSSDDKAAMSKLVNQVSVNQLINWLQRLVESTNTYKLPHLPQLALEMAVLRCVDQATPISAAPVVSQANPVHSPQPAPALPTDSTADLPDVQAVWPQLCSKLEATNPATGALLKSSSAVLDNGKLVVELPSDFLKVVMSKAANHQVLLATLAELGVSGVAVEYRVVKPNGGAKALVGEVFDIM